MKCDAFERYLHRLLDERAPLELDAAAEAHAASCEGCRELLAGFGLLADACGRLRPPSPPANLPQRVVERWNAECGMRNADETPLEAIPLEKDTSPSTRPRRRPRAFGLAASSAAAVAIAVMLLPPEPAEREAAVVPPTTSSPREEAKLGELARDATSRYLDLAEETRVGLADVGALVPLNAAASASAVEDVAVKSDEWNAPLRPFTRTTLGAVSFLFPGSKDSGEEHPPPGS